MHTFSETGAGVPAFLAKLWRLVEDPETNSLIYWSKDGRSFIIQNQAQFARELLPLNYKHNNMASFIRQLNMYGFHKITSIDNGGLKFDRDEMEFTHPCFKRGCPYLLEHIKRKIANTKQHSQIIDDKAGIKVESVSKVLNEVKVMRGRQDSLDSRFSVMKQENEALWREIAALRQKHIKQQQIVNKLIQFLVTIVQPSRNMSGVKRTFQLMINDAPQQTKTRKSSETESGPVIHELTEELLDEVADTEDPDYDILSDPSSPQINVRNEQEPPNLESLSPGSNMERPNSNLSVSSHYYEQQSNQSAEDEKFVNSFNTNSNGSNSESQLIYHIREIPENVEMNNEPMQYVEENVLTTPMVKQEMAKNGQSAFQVTQQQNQFNSIRNMEKRNSRKRKHVRETPTTEYINSSKNLNDSVKVKIENELDPLLFLETSCSSPINSCTLSPAMNPALISPNSNVSTSTNGNNTYLNQTSSNRMHQSTNITSSKEKSIYEGDFLNSDMPSDLFEDSPMLASSSLDRQIPTPSTSKEINNTLNESANSKSNDGEGNDKKNSNGTKNMTVVKYTNQKSIDDIMKLQSPEEIHSHLDGTQDDLESLKDLLRGEGYSFDTSALSGNGNASNKLYLSQPGDSDVWTKLFNDSDILGPYGLSLSNELPENSGNKTGNELTTYQPYGYSDLSDLFDFKDKESGLENSNTADSSNADGTSSVLNTPRPEARKAPF